MSQLPVRAWTQYQVHDQDVRFQSGLRGPVRETRPARAQTRRTATPDRRRTSALWPTSWSA